MVLYGVPNHNRYPERYRKAYTADNHARVTSVVTVVAVTIIAARIDVRGRTPSPWVCGRGFPTSSEVAMSSA